MNKQQRINSFLEALGEFIEKYYSSAVTGVTKLLEGDWIKIRIDGPEGTSLEISSKDEEVTILFAESHWHIDSYDEPCRFEDIYEETIDGVFDILGFRASTYSCWRNGRCIGGASCHSDEEKRIVEQARESFKDFDAIRVQTWANKLKIINV